MNYQDKTKENLLQELREYEQKYSSLKKSLDKESNQRLSAEANLIESENKYQIALQASSDCISITERDGMYIDINEGFTNTTGYTKEDVLGKLSTELNIWAVPEDLEKLIHGLKEKGCIENLESKFRCKDGRIITAIISANIIILNNEPHILAIARDISEHKQMEELILKSKQQYDNLVSHIPVGVYILHTSPKDDFKLDYVSPRMAEMLDISVEKLIAKADTIYDAIYPDDLDGFVNMNLEGIVQKRPFDWKGRVICKGAIKWLHISSSPQELESGDIIWNGLIIDITEQILAEEEIALQNEELRRINAEKDKFFSIIAHDLRSPFNGFLGLTKIMAEELSTLTMAEIQFIAARMSKSATNLYRMLNNLLEWSQVKQGAIRFKPDKIHLSNLVDGCIEVIYESAKGKEIILTKTISDELEVFADVNMLKTILHNLISNAFKFTPKGGNINISAKLDESNNVQIAINDTGIGMNQFLLDNLFRSDIPTARDGTDGEPSTGLGLLLINEFIKKHNGKLWVESEEGKGTTFYCTLPSPPL